MDFIKNVSEQEKIVDLQLFGEIGGDFSGDQFASNIHTFSHYKQINIHINSIGGSITQGYSIIAAMDMARDKGVKIKTINRGIADSMAGMILANGDLGDREALDFSSGLVHEPLRVSEDGTIVRIKDLEEGDEKEHITKFKDSLLTILVNASGKDRGELSSIMENDTRLDAKGLLLNGFVDRVVKSSNKPKITLNMGAAELMAACSTAINKKNNYMNVKEILNVSPEATDQEVEAAVVSLKEEVGTVKADAEKKAEELAEKEKAIEDAKAEVEQLKAEIKEMKDASAEAFVDSSIEKGIFDASKKSDLYASAKKDLESFKNMASMVNVNRHVDVTEMINKSESHVSQEDKMVETFKNADAKGERMQLMQELGEEVYNTYQQAYIKSINKK